MRRWKQIVAALLAVTLCSSLVWAALSTSVTLNFAATFTGSPDLSTLTDKLALNRNISLTSGSGANQADMIFHDQRTLADGATETLDLYASGSLLDPLGSALTIETLKLLYLYNESSDATLQVGGGASLDIGILADTSDILEIPPGGKFLWTGPDATGLDITTNKNLKLTHDGTGTSSLTYEIIAIGVD